MSFINWKILHISHRKYKATIRKFLKELIAQHDSDSEADTSDLELDVWEEVNEDSEDHDNGDSDLFMVDTHPAVKDDLEVPTYSQVSVLINQQYSFLYWNLLFAS